MHPLSLSHGNHRVDVHLPLEDSVLLKGKDYVPFTFMSFLSIIQYLHIVDIQ